MPLLERLWIGQEAVTFGIVVLLALVLAGGSTAFLEPDNLDSLQIAIIPDLLVAIGMMVPFVSGRRASAGPSTSRAATGKPPG